MAGATAGITPAKVPTVYFSSDQVELLSLSTRETLGDYAAGNYFKSLDRPENRLFVGEVRSRYGRQCVTADPVEAGYLEDQGNMKQSAKNYRSGSFVRDAAQRVVGRPYAAEVFY